MQITDPATGFFIINRFIQCYGTSKPPSEPPSKVEVNLLEEIRGIGFDKVIEVDDSFSRIVLKVDIELFCTVRIFPTTVEYSFDFYSFSVPNVIMPDLKKGFLARILKIAQTRYKHLNRVREIFSEIDSKFPTIRPDRHTVSSFIRNIHMGEEVEPVRIVYDPLTDLFSVLNCDFKIEEIEVAFEKIVDFIASINRVECRECGICYSDFLDGQVANFNCPNVDGCQHVYHESCLREWFLSNPESKSVFNRISGNCLFCEKVSHFILQSFIVLLLLLLFCRRFICK